MAPFRACFLALALLISACGQPESPAAESPAAEAPAADAPPGTDIHLFELTDQGPSHLRHVTDRAGYDNQPHFTPDGQQILFTSDRTGNMDTFAFSVESGEVTQITSTEEGEYSPTVVSGDAERFSAIRMDLDGVQELWHYPLSEGANAAPVAEIDRVGYHTWVDSDRVLFFRLGRPATLQLVTAGAADTTIIVSGVGRSLHRHPTQRASAYLVNLEDDYREIRLYDWDSGESTSVAVPLEGGQDFALEPDGSVVMAIDGILYRYTPGQMVDWEEIGDLGLKDTSRLAVSQDGSLLAVVAGRE